jgi:poly-gamma-glutamate synthesis protein (capsule biosynthesis protein)
VAAATLAAAACAPDLASQAAVPPSATRPPVTRIVSVDTETATLAPPTETPTPTSTNSPTATPTTEPATPTATALPQVRFMAVGDVMLARTVGERVLAEGPETVFAGVLPTLSQADLLAANLECVISDRGEPVDKAYVFRAPPQALAALAQAGVDVLSLANNHAFDYGVDALADMLPGLRAEGIVTVGAGVDAEAAHAPVFVERNGLRIAFLAYVDVPVEGRTGFDTRSWAAGPDQPGLAWAEPQAIAFDVAAAGLRADVVVVMMHFGLEGRRDVTSNQRTLAQGAIDAGADLVLGAHPHVLQPVEEYNGGVIAYSLGNFVFDGFAPPATYSAIFSATLTTDGVAAYEWVPVVISHGLPQPAPPAEAENILAQLAPESP